MATIGVLAASLGIGWAMYTITMCVMDLSARAMRDLDEWLR